MLPVLHLLVVVVPVEVKQPAESEESLGGVDQPDKQEVQVKVAMAQLIHVMELARVVAVAVDISAVVAAEVIVLPLRLTAAVVAVADQVSIQLVEPAPKPRNLEMDKF